MLEIRIIIVLIVWNFQLEILPEPLSSFRAEPGVVPRPENMFFRLKALR